MKREMTPQRVAMKILCYTTKVMAANETGTVKNEMASRIFRRHYGNAMSVYNKKTPR